jgi:hypothetical protein
MRRTSDTGVTGQPHSRSCRSGGLMTVEASIRRRASSLWKEARAEGIEVRFADESDQRVFEVKKGFVSDGLPDVPEQPVLEEQRFDPPRPVEVETHGAWHIGYHRSWRLCDARPRPWLGVHRCGCRLACRVPPARDARRPVPSPLAAEGGLTIIKGGCCRNGRYSRPVLVRKPASSAGRYCIRLRRVFTRTVNSAMVCLVRLVSDRFRWTRPTRRG